MRIINNGKTITNKCEINHEGSSEEMEAAAAVQIFKKSIKTRELKYTTFVGDSGSSSFGRVKEAVEKEFGTAYEIKKEECVGHVQKRLGTALRKYKNDMKGKKLSDGKGVRGKGRLTDKTIDKIFSCKINKRYIHSTWNDEVKKHHRRCESCVIDE